VGLNARLKGSSAGLGTQPGAFLFADTLSAAMRAPARTVQALAHAQGRVLGGGQCSQAARIMAAETAQKNARPKKHGEPLSVFAPPWLFLRCLVTCR